MTALPLRDFTAAEQDKLDAIEAAPAADESVRERVAAALWEEAVATSHLAEGWDASERRKRRALRFQHLADAAIAVLSGPSSDAEQAVERVTAALAKEPEISPRWEFERGVLRGIEMTKTVVLAAIAGDQR